MTARPLHELPGVSAAEAGAFAAALQSALEKDGVLDLPGIGQFMAQPGGALRFTPDADLGAAVNSRYEGLPPLLLARAGGQVIEETGYVPAPIADGLEAEENPDAPVFTPVSEPVAVTLNQESGDAEGGPGSTAAGPENHPPAASEPAAAQAAARKRPLRWLLPVAAVAAAAVLFWMMRPQSAPAPAPITELPVPAPDTVLLPAPVDTASVFQDSAAVPDSLTPVPPAPMAEPQSPPGYGLTLPADTTVHSFYTLVVHSLDIRSKADRQLALIQNQGFRAFVQEADVNGTTAYRVGIGQFATVDEARAAVPGLPEPFRNAFFIKRFNQNPSPHAP